MRIIISLILSVSCFFISYIILKPLNFKNESVTIEVKIKAFNEDQRGISSSFILYYETQDSITFKSNPPSISSIIGDRNPETLSFDIVSINENITGLQLVCPNNFREIEIEGIAFKTMFFYQKSIPVDSFFNAATVSKGAELKLTNDTLKIVEKYNKNSEISLIIHNDTLNDLNKFLWFGRNNTIAIGISLLFSLFILVYTYQLNLLKKKITK